MPSVNARQLITWKKEMNQAAADGDLDKVEEIKAKIKAADASTKKSKKKSKKKNMAKGKSIAGSF